MKTTTELIAPPAETEAGPVRGMWCGSSDIIPILHDRPLSREAAIAIWEHVQGERPVDWTRRIKLEPSYRPALEGEMEQQGVHARGCAIAFLLGVARMIGPLPSDVLRFETAAGCPVDVGTVDWCSYGHIVKPPSPSGFATAPPRLVE